MSLKKEQRGKNISYPQNLLKALKYDIEVPTEDQILGLEFVLGQLKESHREVVELHYKNGLTYRKISEQIGKSSTRCSQIGITAIRRLQKIDWMVWVEDGYQGHLNKQKKLAEEIQKNITDMAFKADEMDNYLADTFGCEFSEYAKKDAI